MQAGWAPGGLTLPQLYIYLPTSQSQSILNSVEKPHNLTEFSGESH